MEETPLFERMGGRDGIVAVVGKAIANHLANPVVGTRFAHAGQTVDEMNRHAVEFFCTGLSGVATYEGRAMPDAHAGMNVSEQEFVAVLDDILDAMRSTGIGEREQAEVLAILYGMKGEIVHR